VWGLVIRPMEAVHGGGWKRDIEGIVEGFTEKPER